MILVSGATGLIGSHLTLYLARKGHSLRAIYRNEESIKKTRNIFTLYSSQPDELFHKIEWLKADITDITTLENVFDNVSQVYHCAALVSFDNRKKNLLFQTNVEGTSNMLHLAMKNGIDKFMHMSSIAALGTYDRPVTEKTHWNWKSKHSEYAVSKYLSEMEVWRASQEGLPVVIINPSVVLGAGFWKEGSNKIFKMLDKGMNFYPSGGNNFVDVWDVVKVADKLMQSNITNDSFIVGGCHTSYKNLLTLVAQALNKKSPSHKMPVTLAKLITKINWLKSKITSQPNNLSSDAVRVFFENPEYSSEKLVETLNHQFIPLEATINNIASQYLKVKRK